MRLEMLFSKFLKNLLKKNKNKIKFLKRYILGILVLVKNY